MSLTNSPWLGIIKLFPPRESLVSNIPARDRKTDNLFLQCTVQTTVIFLATSISVQDQTEALHLANMIASHGYFFPIGTPVFLIS
jgi:hypothetical protein